MIERNRTWRHDAGPGQQPCVPDRMVVDRTGRKEDFDLELEWTPFQTPASLDPAAASDRPVDSGPSIFTAIQEQLGLRLQSDRAPVDVLVVERLEQPTPD